MLTRLFITTAILGMCLMIPSGMAVADGKPDDVAAREKPDIRVLMKAVGPIAVYSDHEAKIEVKEMKPGTVHKGHKAKLGVKVMRPGTAHKMEVPGMQMMGPVIGRGHDSVMVRFDPMRRSDPEMYRLVARDRDLERGSMELSERFRRAPEEAREEVKERIEEVVVQHFEARQQRRQLELTRLEKELKRLNAAIKRRQEARDDIIKRRIMQLTGEEDPLDF